MREFHRPDALAQRSLNAAWFAALVIAVGTLGIPSGGATQFGVLTGYPSEVAQNVYQLIRVVMPWLPVGVLLALAVPRPAIRLAVLVAVTAGIVLAFSGAGAGAGLPLARDLLFVVPGVALGTWLAEASAAGHALPLSQRVPDKSQRRVAPDAATAPAPGDPRSAHAPANAAAPPALANTATLTAPADAESVSALAEPSAGAQPTMPSRVGSQALAHGDARTWAARLIGAALATGAIVIAFGMPRWGVELALGLALYAALVGWRPLASLVAVPAALPLLDLAPWTGRFFLDEFDLLVAVTVGMMLVRGRSRPTVAAAPLGMATIALFLATTAVALGIGLFPLAPVDANAFSSYWSPFNALRVGKGVLWGTVLFWLVRRAAASGEPVLVRWLGVGMGLGLLGVGLVGAWERWLFAGLADKDSVYRIFSTFSSMHTGGGHIEAYLVAALPFLWLGLFRWRTALLVTPVFLLTAYVMVFTVARGGVLAFALITAILVTATLRSAWQTGLRHAGATWLGVTVLIGTTAVVVAGAAGGYFLQRFAVAEQDWNTRVAHWRLALGLDADTWPNRLFGSGLGSFPRAYLWNGPRDQQPAAFAYQAEQGNTFLRMGVGETLYMAQRLPVQGGVAYRLKLDLRSSTPAAQLATPLCEKQMLNSRRCDWHAFGVPGDGQWQTFTHSFTSVKVGHGPAWSHLPVELYFHNAGKTGTIDIDRVSLVDPQGRELVGNGDFTQGGDFWFFKTQSHLPWHIKNFWVHTYFETGAAGLLATLVLTGLAVLRLARAGWAGSRLAWALLASLAGLLTVGVFDSLIDAPRLATLLFGWTMLGATLAWQRRPSAASNRPG